MNYTLFKYFFLAPEDEKVWERLLVLRKKCIFAKPEQQCCLGCKKTLNYGNVFK